MSTAFKTHLLINTTVAVLLWTAASLAASVDVITAWSESTAAGHAAFTSQKVDNEWSTPQLITKSSNRILSVAIGSNSFKSKLGTPSTSTDTLAVWTEVVDQKWLLKYSELREGGWVPAKNLTTLGGENLSPIIVHDLASNAWVFWSSNARGNDDIYYKQRINGIWSGAQMVNEKNEYPDILPRAYLNKSGSVAVQWRYLDQTSNSYNYREKVFPLQSELKNIAELLKAQLENADETMNAGVPLEANRAKRVNLHFPQNLHDQSTYIQLN